MIFISFIHIAFESYSWYSFCRFVRKMTISLHNLGLFKDRKCCIAMAIGIVDENLQFTIAKAIIWKAICYINSIVFTVVLLVIGCAYALLLKPKWLWFNHVVCTNTLTNMPWRHTLVGSSRLSWINIHPS